LVSNKKVNRRVYMSVSNTKKTVQNRWIPVIASIAIQMCLGTAYIWSVFQSYLIISKTTPDALFNWPATYGTLAFSLLLLLLTAGGIAGGRMKDKLKSPRPVIMISGVIIGLGFIIAMFTSETTPWLLWLSYGILGGFGMGMAYSVTIATCQKWFPDKRGLVTGIIVSALGFGGLVFTPIAEGLIKSFGVLSTFAILGYAFIVIVVVGALFITEPPEGFKPKGWIAPAQKHGIIAQNFSPMEVLKTPQFYMIIIAFMCATAAGLMMIPMAKILGLQPSSGLTKEAAVAGVMIIAACNSFGRLFWGWVSDRMGRKNTLLTLIVIAGVSIVTVSFTSSYLMLVLIAIIGFSYGGFLGVFPCLTSDFYGIKHAATNYGMVLFGFGAGAVVSSFTVGYLGQTKQFSTAFLIAGIAAAVGFVVMLLLKAPKLKAEK
jgi:OFA family oxalate/formate antiporter-like MFS transporter